jgi:hypothetical protein
MDSAARAKAHPFTAFMEPSGCMVAHNRLTDLHLECHVCKPMDRPPLVRTGDASQEAYDAVIESEFEPLLKSEWVNLDRFWRLVGVKGGRSPA